MCVKCVLTVEEHTGVMYAQTVGGHAGVVSVIVLRDVGYGELSAGAGNVNTNPLHVRQSGERKRERQTEKRSVRKRDRKRLSERERE